MDPNQKKNADLKSKEIMKEEENVEIPNETSDFIEKACEWFIKDITMRSMLKSNEAGRTTIEVNDVVGALGPIELQFDPEIEKTARAIRKATREAQASRGKALLGGTPDCQGQSLATMEEEQDPPVHVPPVPQPQRRTLGDYGRRDNDALANQGFQPANPVSFDIKNTVLSALKENPYSGSEAQCPNLHLSHFYEACDYTDPPGALEQMPSYAKFLKELLTKKRKPLDDEMVSMTEECSALIQRKLPQKKKDPGSFTIPCSIGDLTIGKALCDLGASVNLMPLSMMKKIPGAVAKPTKMSLSLADRSIVYPEGILHDVLVRVAGFVFPADFVVLDMEEDKNWEPLLLGRPFLATGRALIDVELGELMLRTDGEQILFNVFEAIKQHDDDTQCFRIELVDEVIEDIFKVQHSSSTLEKVLVNSMDNLEDEWEREIELCLSNLNANRIDESPKFENLFEVNAKDQMEEERKAPELKQLPSHLKYVFLSDDASFPAIISSKLTHLEEEKLLRVLKSNKAAMGWTISDLKGISPTFCMHKIKLEAEFKPVVQPQRRLNPTMKEVVKKEVLKLLEAGMIYPISDSAWVSPVHVVPKKGGMTVVKNDKNEFIPSRTVTGWRMCIDYRRLNTATRKDHFPLPFMDQMLERLAGQKFYCFLDGYSGYNQITVDPEDQEKTAFTCPFGVFAYRRMPFGLCNAPATFQRCMLAIFSDMMEDTMEVFMDDFSVFGKSFDFCLSNLNDVLKRCISTNLVLNWEKCHFMVREGIVLGHKISSKGIEVDQAKIEVIKELPPPLNVKGVRSFLGHAGFYRWFIKDFSKIVKPLSSLLVKDTVFLFDEACVTAFNCLKAKLVTAPVIVAPQWDLPFELMCDASDYAVGAVLGQHHNKLFHVIYYSSKVLDENQINYTTTEKELLAVVFALEKFRSYLIGSKVIVFTGHSALKYLLTKGDSKPRLLRWMLLLQEFDLEIRDKKGVENVVADHLSRLSNPDVTNKEEAIKCEFPDEKLLAVSEFPWFGDIANLKACGFIPEEMTAQQKKKLFADSRHYFWDDPFLFKMSNDGMIRRSVYYNNGKPILFRINDDETFDGLKQQLNQLYRIVNNRNDNRTVSSLTYRKPSIDFDGRFTSTDMMLENNDDMQTMFSIFEQYSTRGPIELDVTLTRSVETILASLVRPEDPNYVSI
ncbi:unnamed protein product [Trifolium pratense]|uniref:Uncharacterized protein n=1 Tax=Trifolium pratense TaxID=57577 RepID=A0ACB0IZH4_TRIPR|nr:unnamed protein product [Trifolium pratense]